MCAADAAVPGRNCGAAAGARFCPECGQETAAHPPTAGEFVHELVGHYVALEGKLWKTLALLLRPGRLTLEYLAGHKVRYIAPLRLYLTASVVFFLAAKLLAPDPVVRMVVANDGMPTVVACEPGTPACSKFDALIQRRLRNTNTEQLVKTIRERLVQETPYAMFLLLPVFALLTRFAYRRRPLNYGEHLVFALHVHAFAFLLGALFVPLHALIFAALLAGAYVALAMRRVFGGRTWPLVLRFAFVFGCYFLLVQAAIVSIALLALVS
jgi:Protein of unknown function (DUF3667)